MPVKNNPKISIILTCFNYEKFVAAALNSALYQAYNNLEVILVDDSSTDSSIQVINAFGGDQRVNVVAHASNLGQAAAFNTAFELCTGDIICFLDADDIYASNYLEIVARDFKENLDADFISYAVQSTAPFDVKDPIPKEKLSKPIRIGSSVCSASLFSEWLGNVTSSISMRRSVAEKIFPLPHASDWKTRADGCLIWGASLAGAVKYKSNTEAVFYRIHEENHFAGKNVDAVQNPSRFYKICALKNAFLKRFDINSDAISSMCHTEFCDRNDRSAKLGWNYVKGLLMLDIPLSRFILTSLRILRVVFTAP